MQKFKNEFIFAKMNYTPNKRVHHAHHTVMTELSLGNPLSAGNIYSLVDSMKANILSKIDTGVPLYNTIIAFLLLSLQDPFVQSLYKAKNVLLGTPMQTFTLLKFMCKWYIRHCTRRTVETKIEKTVKISYFTEANEINTLFDQVMWYLCTLTDVKIEENVSLEITKNNTAVTQRLPKNYSSKIKFLDHTIEYKITSELKTFYAEREHKRENTVITLSTTTSKERSEDIIQQFADTCKKKYDEYQKKKVWQQKIYRNTGTQWTEKPSKVERKLDTVILKRGQMETVTADINDFTQKEEWYVSRDIPYTRRYMFFGSPGTGKSSCIKALACHTKRHIHYLVLSEVKSDNDLFKLFEAVNFETTIMVIEDIDCASTITHTRADADPTIDHVSKEKGSLASTLINAGLDEDQLSVIAAAGETAKKTTLTLSGLLNAIDGGIIENHGQIMIMTSNHPERLDPALTRPGRVDNKFELSNCDLYQINGLFYNFFGKYPSTDATVIVPPDVSPAEATSEFLKFKNDPDKAWTSLLELFEKKRVEAAKAEALKD